MDKIVLKIENLSHRYGREWAIQNINLEVKGNGIVGLLGSNGAGKSTTMNIMCGVLGHTSGNIFIDSIDLDKQPEKAKRKLGFLPQVAPLYMDLTIDEYLTHCAYLRLMKKSDIPAAVFLVKEQCGVAQYSKRLIKNLSGGYRQRVGIAQAIIHKPELVVLDEPTNGLDPNQIVEVRNLIKEIARDRAVIFSSHILSEIQATCKDIVMIEKGKIVFSDTMPAFYNYIKPNSLIVSLDAPPQMKVLLNMSGIISADLMNERQIRLKFNGDPDRITRSIVESSVQNGWALTEITLEKSSMDEVFAQLSKN